MSYHFSITEKDKKIQEPLRVPASHDIRTGEDLLLLMPVGSESLLPLVGRYLVLLSFPTTRHGFFLLIQLDLFVITVGYYAKLWRAWSIARLKLFTMDKLGTYRLFRTETAVALKPLGSGEPLYACGTVRIIQHDYVRIITFLKGSDPAEE